MPAIQPRNWLAASNSAAFASVISVPKVSQDAALADDIHKFELEVLGGLPVGVILLEAPGMVERGWNFPIFLKHLVGNLVIAGGGVVAFDAEAAIDQRGRLHAVHDVDEAGAAIAGHHARGI